VQRVFEKYSLSQKYTLRHWLMAAISISAPEVPLADAMSNLRHDEFRVPAFLLRPPQCLTLCNGKIPNRSQAVTIFQRSRISLWRGESILLGQKASLFGLRGNPSLGRPQQAGKRRAPGPKGTPIKPSTLGQLPAGHLH